MCPGAIFLEIDEKFSALQLKGLCQETLKCRKFLLSILGSCYVTFDRKLLEDAATLLLGQICIEIILLNAPAVYAKFLKC